MDNVLHFQKQRHVERYIVKHGNVRLALPEKWTKEKWEKLSKKERGFIFFACTSFRFYLHRVYLPFKSEIQGEEYPKKLPEFMGVFADSIQKRVPSELLPFDHDSDPNLLFRVCRVWPTGCFKSSLLEAFESWMMGINPNISIVKGLAKAELGERFVEFHRSNISNNEIYRFVFGDLNPKHSQGDRTWRMNAFTVERSLPHSAPTYAIVGYQGSFEGTRFDIGLLDDLVDFQNSKTEDSRREQYNWVSQVFERRLHPRRRLLFAIGTIHNWGDFYNRCRVHAQNEGTWDYEEITMIPEKAIRAGLWPPKKKNPSLPYSMDNVIVPEKLPVLWDFWTPKVLVEEFVSNPHAFALTRQNQVHDPDSGLFTEGDLNHCLADGGVTPDGVRKPDLPLWNYSEGIPQPGSPIYEMYQEAGIDIEYAVVVMDFAATTPKPGKDPDWTVYMMWGWCQNTRRRILLDMRRFRTGNPKLMKERLVSFVQGYLPIVRRIAGEANAVDKLFVNDLGMHMREKLGIGVSVVELKSEKADLITSFKDLIFDEGVWIPYTNRSRRTRQLVGIFKDELVKYPDAAHDDTVIAAVHHLRLLKSGSFSGNKVKATIIGSEDPDHVDDLSEIPEELEEQHESPWAHVQAERKRVAVHGC